MTASRTLAAALFLLAVGCDETLGGDNAEPLFDGDSSLVGNSSSVSITTADSEPVIIDVPDGTLSFAVVLSDLGSTLAQPAKITNPAGEVVWEVGVTPTNRADAYAEVQATVVPVNPDVVVTPGEWEFIFFGNASASATVDAVFRLDTVPDSGTLNLNLHFVGLELIDAETAPDDEAFQDVLAGVREVYSSAGISIGDVNYYDLDDDSLSVLTTNAVGSDELLTLLENYSGQRDNRAVNVYFVADIEDPTSSASLLGVSGGVPGPPGLHGLARSGVAINMANYLAVVEAGENTGEVETELETVLAHELGHYLGLFHTTEANGAELSGPANGEDPLDDTSTCPDTSDANSDGILSASECGAPAQNLMFWSPTNGTRTLSSDQRQILKYNPVVR